MENRNSWYRRLPKVDVLLDGNLVDLKVKYGKMLVMEAVNLELNRIREMIPQMETEDVLRQEIEGIETQIEERLMQGERRSFQRVINATGVVLHTNLGRSPLPKEITLQAISKLTGYSNLEYNLEEGARGERYAHFEKLICKVTGAEAALAVNNNAAAVLLMMSAIGNGKEIIVSRGEQIEIGGKFRIPDIMDQSGCKRVEVGTTNKTHLSDYAEAITEDTAALLKVHTSNFRIEGFTESVSREAMVELADKHQIPVIEDLGSGVLLDLSRYGLNREPTVMDSLNAGVDLVSFSGDKLLGGPQAGIIVGKKQWIDQCKKHPLTRAMRIDKFAVAILEEIFAIYQDVSIAEQKIPVLAMLKATEEELRSKADCLMDALTELKSEYQISIVSCDSTAGGGSLPGEVIPSVGVRIYREGMHAGTIQTKLHHAKQPLMVLVVEDGLVLDMRTLFLEELEETASILADILKE